MIRNIEIYPISSGRKIKEDGTVVNVAETINTDNTFKIKEKFKKIETIYPSFAVSTINIIKAINGKDCTVNVLTGSIWINPNATATIANSVKITGAIDLNVSTNLNLISDATGATVQIIVWGD